MVQGMNAIHLLPEFTPFHSVPMFGYKLMPSLLPLDCYNIDEMMRAEEEMDVETVTPKMPHPMDLTTRMASHPHHKSACYRTTSTDSLITNGSMEDNDGENNDFDLPFRSYRPRLPTADMVLMLNKRRLLSKVPACEPSIPLNLSTKEDKPVKEDADVEFGCAEDCSCQECSKRAQHAESASRDHNRFDWSEYRRSMSCSQIDFRIHKKIAEHRRLMRESSATASSSGNASPAEMSYDRDDGFHDELEGVGKCPDIRNSPVKRLMNCRISGGPSRRHPEQTAFPQHQDSGSLLMSQPPEAFVQNLEQLSFDTPMQRSKQDAFLQSLSEQYKPMNTFPVDAYGYYAHLMHRLQAHHILESNNRHSSPNLSESPPQADEAQNYDGNNMYSGVSGKKRPPRALTGRHVREGTGASPSTLVSLRKAIEERQRFKKTEITDKKSMSRKKCGKSSSMRPRAYSATLSAVRTVNEDPESDTISIASE